MFSECRENLTYLHLERKEAPKMLKLWKQVSEVEFIKVSHEVLTVLYLIEALDL